MGRSIAFGFLFTALLIFSGLSLAEAADYNPENPVDLYGSDGLPFTPDDPLIARGGYTNTAIFATAFGEKPDGMNTPDLSSNEESTKAFKFAIGSWAYDPGTVVIHMLCTEDDEYSNDGTAKWRPLPAPMDGSADLSQLFTDPDLFARVENPADIQTPLEAYGFSGATMVPDGEFLDKDWWANGENLRVSLLSFSNWEFDGDIDADDPSVTISTDHFPKVKDFIKEIRVEKNRSRFGALSALNIESGKSGVAGFGFLNIGGLEVELDGEISDMDVSGTVKNDSPSLTVSVDLPIPLGDADIEVTIVGDDQAPIDSIWDAAGALLTSEVDVGAIWVVNGLRGELQPPLGDLGGAAEDRLETAFANDLGIDCLANEIVRAIIRGGKWMPWVPASDAGVMTRSSDDVDLSTTKLDDSRTIKVQEYLEADNGPESVSNGGLDYLISDTLIYGRDPSGPYNRLVEWFAQNWLCLNMTDFQPYAEADGSQSQAKSQWRYYDLITQKEITDPDGDGDSQPFVIDDGWPPPGPWFGGQGMVLGAQAAIGHDGNASGPEKPDYNDPVSPGSPSHVLAAIVALTPYAEENYASYNLQGITLGDGEGWELQFVDDPIGGSEEWKIEWPPPNDWPESEVKFFHASVANGHDDFLTNGEFRTIWDFSGTHETINRFGNASYRPGSDFGRLFVYDKSTRRTGVHQIGIFYE